MDWYKTQPKIPLVTFNGLERYVIKGIRPGGYLNAVICNNLFQALGQADQHNRHAIGTLATFINSKCPAACFGNPELVQDWIDQDGLAGITDPAYLEEVFQQYREHVLSQ